MQNQVFTTPEQKAENLIEVLKHESEVEFFQQNRNRFEGLPKTKSAMINKILIKNMSKEIVKLHKTIDGLKNQIK